MKNKIIFKNPARVGRVLGVKLKRHEEVEGRRGVRNENPVKQLEESGEWKEFKEKYTEYFETFEPKKLAEFFEKTGLRMTHLVSDKKNNMTFLFTMFGWTYEGYIGHAYSFSEDKLIFGYGNLSRQMKQNEEFQKLPWGGRVHMEHILVRSEIDDINELDFKFQEKDIMKMHDDVRELNYELATTSGDEEDKKKHLKGRNNERGKVKQEFYNTFSEHVVLYENGELYINDKLYDKKVRGIFSQDSANNLIVFDDNTVEILSAYEEYTDDYYLNAGEYDKIEMSKMMLALLNKSRGGFCELLLITVDYNMPDVSVVYSYENVGDIELRDFSSSEDDDVLKSFSTRLVMKPADVHHGKEIHMMGLPVVCAPFADE